MDVARTCTFMTETASLFVTEEVNSSPISSARAPRSEMQDDDTQHYVGLQYQVLVRTKHEKSRHRIDLECRHKAQKEDLG
jgi:hypothetical protein